MFCIFEVLRRIIIHGKRNKFVMAAGRYVIFSSFSNIFVNPPRQTSWRYPPPPSSSFHLSSRNIQQYPPLSLHKARQRLYPLPGDFSIPLVRTGYKGDFSAYLLLTSSASIFLRPTTAQQVNNGILVSLECLQSMEGLAIIFALIVRF